MSFGGDNLQNVNSKTFVDLTSSSPTPGTAIIVENLNVQPSGTPNQQWRITPAPVGKNLFIIQSVATGQYAVIDGLADVNKPIISGPVSMPWEINGAGNFAVTIGVPYTNLMWNIASNDLGTQITLAKQDGTAKQQWIPRTTLPPN